MLFRSGYREHEEILDEERGIFISRIFNADGLLLEEIEKSREMVLLKRKVYEYNDKHQPKLVKQYNSAGKLIKTSKYKKTRSLDYFRTPGN